MTATKQARWTCLTCNKGGLAPTKPRRDDVRRYCLPCSAKTGRLVERVSPALEKQRQERTAKMRERCKKKRQKVSSQQQAVNAHERQVRKRQQLVETEAQRLWKLLAPYHKGKPMPPITIVDTRQMRGASGYWQDHGFSERIVIRLVPYGTGLTHETRAWKVLLHELCHAACPPRDGDSHHREFYYAMKTVAEKRWKCLVSFASLRGNRWGYEVDHLIEDQLRKAGVVKFPLPETRQRPIG